MDIIQDERNLDGARAWCQVIYALHAFSVLTGIFGAASVIGAFLIGWPSIIAVILNYVKRSEVEGTWLESHFRWQIRTFWFSLLWVVVAVLIGLTVIGLPLTFGILVGVTFWLIYRVVRGWLALNARATIGTASE
jgi:uncharacterized membrane protein